MNRRVASYFLGGLLLGAVAALPVRAATVTVTSAADKAADDGECTLREAITAANINKASGTKSGECAAGDPIVRDDIIFMIPGSGPFKITPGTPLPPVTEAAFIDGYSQPGAKPNTLRSGGDAVLMLEVRGDSMTRFCDPAGPIAQAAAFQFIGALASGSRLRGLAIGGFAYADSPTVLIFRAGNVQIDGNFIGLDVVGKRLDNAGAGIAVLNGAFTLVGDPPKPFDDGGPGNLVGGTSPAERNVIANSNPGIFLGGQHNRVEGNYIGVDPTGTISTPNFAHGVQVGTIGVLSCDGRTGYSFAGSQNIIGGGSSGSGNFFSAEASDCAVNLRGGGNDVRGNFMGTDRDGGAGPTGFGLGAQPGCGVLVEGAAAKDNTIVYNKIAFNSKGVVLRASGAVKPMRNDIRANSIHSNMSLGIDLENDGVTANDAGDNDIGSNGLQNFPERLAATLTGVRGVVISTPNIEQRIDFYQSRRCHSSKNGEGERYLGSTSLIPDSSGKASFNVSLAGLQMEQVVTATATTATDGTSEFSACARVLPGLSVSVEVQSSLNPVRSHEKYQLTALVHGSGGTMPTGVVTLYDTAHTTLMPNGQTVFHFLASATLTPSATLPDTAFALFDSNKLQRMGSEWGNLPIRAQYLGDSTYAPTASSPDFVQTVYREKSDLDGDGSTDLVLCNSANEKFLVQDVAGTFKGPFALTGIGPTHTLIGTAEFGVGHEPAVVWRDTGSGTIGGTTFAGGAIQQDFTIPLPAGMTFEGLGSMYGDLKDDIILRDAAGQHFGALTLSIGSNTLGLAQPWRVDQPNAYSVGFPGDFNGDGNLDWHLENATVKAHALWLLDGSFGIAARGALAAPMLAQGVAATGDFDGDGRTDFVWTLSSGGSQIVLQDGLVTRGVMTLSNTVVGTGYFDDGTGTSGGRSSLVVRNPTSGQLDALINTGVSAGLPVFGQIRAIPTGGQTDLTVCVP
jgi:CSLREA domain-containing protein